MWCFGWLVHGRFCPNDNVCEFRSYELNIPRTNGSLISMRGDVLWPSDCRGCLKCKLRIRGQSDHERSA